MSDASSTPPALTEMVGPLRAIVREDAAENRYSAVAPYKAFLPEFLSLKPEDVLVVNVDIPKAISSALGVAPRLAGLRDSLAALPEFDLDAVLDLRRYAMALGHAHTVYLLALRPENSVRPLAEQGKQLRSMLIQDATALVQRKLLDGGPLARLEGPSGYRELASDLHLLASWLYENLKRLEGKCLVRLDELAHAERLSFAILEEVGRRDRGSEQLILATELRARAFTVFKRVYDEARLGVTYLHSKKKALDVKVPSLYPRRGKRQKAAAATTPIAPEPAEAPSIVAPTVPDTPIQVAPSPEATHRDIPRHAPGSEPFLS